MRVYPFLALFLSLWGLSACQPKEVTNPAGIVHQIRQAPTADFLDADGNSIRLTDFAGELLILNYWATWCAPCEAEMPSLAKLHDTYSAQGVRVIALSVDDITDIDFAKDRLNTLSEGVLTFYSRRPKNWDVFSQSGALGFPTTLIIDQSGKEIARYEGGLDWFSPEVRAYIETLID